MKNFSNFILIFILIFGLVIYVTFKFFQTDLEDDIRSGVSNFLKNKIINYPKDFYNNEAISLPQDFIVDTTLIGFTDKLVYSSGEEIQLHYRSNEEFSLLIQKADNAGFETILKENLSDSSHERLIFNTYEGFDSKDFKKYSFNTDHAGWVQISLKSEQSSQTFPIFVEPDRKGGMLFVESTNTFKAYQYFSPSWNHYLYPNNLKGIFTRPKNYPISYSIKYHLRDGVSNDWTCVQHLINADLVLKQTLNSIGIDFDISSEEIFEREDSLDKYTTIFFGAHHEYWSLKKLKKIKSFIDSGGKVVFLGGNTAYRWILHTNERDYIWGSSVLKDNHQDFIENYLGSYYDERGYGTSSSFKARDHRVLPKKFNFLSEVDHFGTSSIIKGCQNKIHGASGIETDKLLSTSKGFHILAKGTNGFSGGSDLIYKEFPEGGEILNFGSISLWHRIDDPVIQKIIKTFINH